MKKNFFTTIAIFALFAGYTYGQQQNNAVIIQQNLTPVVIERPVYIERYRTVYVEKPQPKRVARKLPKPVQLLGYLWVYPEDIGNFKQQPFDVIASINAQNPYGRNDWRIPTPDELAVLENNADVVGLGDDIYLATDHTNGVLRLVSTGKTVAEKEAEERARIAKEQARAAEEAKKLKDGFVVNASQLGAATFDGISGTITNTGGSDYKVRSMGGVWWMIQNADKPLSTSQGCTYNSFNKDNLGNLYSQNCAAMACPLGWQLPTDEDFKNLNKWLIANNKWSEWNSGNALGGGANDGHFYFDQNKTGYWWSSNKGSAWWVRQETSRMENQSGLYNGVSYCVRCIKK